MQWRVDTRTKQPIWHENYPFVLLEVASFDRCGGLTMSFDLDRPVKDLKAERSLGREGDDVLPFYEPWGLIKPLTVDMGESGDEG